MLLFLLGSNVFYVCTLKFIVHDLKLHMSDSANQYDPSTLVSSNIDAIVATKVLGVLIL